MGSEVKERRQLIKLVLQNLGLGGRVVRFEAIKPFDTLLSYQDYQLILRLTDEVRANYLKLGNKV